LAWLTLFPYKTLPLEIKQDLAIPQTILFFLKTTYLYDTSRRKSTNGSNSPPKGKVGESSLLQFYRHVVAIRKKNSQYNAKGTNKSFFNEYMAIIYMLYI
jgi:hypothetical protein